VKVVALPKPCKYPKFPQNLRPIRLLFSTGKVFEKVIPEIVKRRTGERNLLNASQFAFRARHSTTLQCMRLFLGPRANNELVPKFHVALHASHAALQS
jgi:hypothetical protein